MSNKKDKKEKPSKKSLTEWQQRNLEFLERKREREAEQRRKEQEARDAAKASLRALETPEEEEDSEEIEVKQEKKTPLISGKEFLKALPVFLLSLLVLGISGFMLTPYSTNKIISVSGQVNATVASIEKGADIKSSDYISSVWLNRSKYALRVVASNDWVKSARINYQFPNHFIIKVKEYKIVAYTDTEDGYRPILENGKRPVSEPVTQIPKGYITINLTDEQKIQTIISQLGLVDDKIVKHIDSIDPIETAATKDLLLLTMSDGHQIRIPLSKLARKLPYYSQILPNLTEPSIVDMEVGIYTTTEYLESVLAQNRSRDIEKAEEETPLEESEPVDQPVE